MIAGWMSLWIDETSVATYFEVERNGLIQIPLRRLNAVRRLFDLGVITYSDRHVQVAGAPIFVLTPLGKQCRVSQQSVGGTVWFPLEDEDG